MNLKTLGINTYFENQVKQEERVGRISYYSQQNYTIVSATGTHQAIVLGKMHYQQNYPRIGDFVVFHETDDHSCFVIDRILDRQTVLKRKEAGNRSHEQIIAANMDYLFLVMSLNEDFNLRRLERYLIGAWESGAEPVVVLTKSDLCDDLEEKLALVETIAIGVNIFAISVLENQDLEVLENYRGSGKTIALVGSSGVGKSTLVNYLADAEVMKVDGLRNDDKGHHTTTHREMIITDRGLIIDTPGMREFTVYEAGDGMASAFDDIETLQSSCKFGDCQHNNEPGCAVNKALESGELDEKRYSSYLMLQREIAFQDRKRRQQAKLSDKTQSKQKKRPRKKNWNSANI